MRLVRLLAFLALAQLAFLALGGQALATTTLRVEWSKNGFVYGVEYLTSSGSSVQSGAAPNFGGNGGVARVKAIAGAAIISNPGPSPTATQTGTRLQIGEQPVIINVNAGDKLAAIESTDPVVNLPTGGFTGGAVSGPDAEGAPVSGNPVRIGGKDALGNVVSLYVDDNGFAHLVLENGLGSTDDTHLSNIDTYLNNINSHVGDPGSMRGTTAAGATPPNPVGTGCTVLQTSPTTIGDTLLNNVACTGSGKLIDWLFAPPQLSSDVALTFGTGTAAAQNVLAAAGAGIKIKIADVQCFNKDTVANGITLSDGTLSYYVGMAAGGGNNQVKLVPLSFAANTTVTATPDAAPTTNPLKCTFGVFTGKE